MLLDLKELVPWIVIAQLGKYGKYVIAKSLHSADDILAPSIGSLLVCPVLESVQNWKPVTPSLGKVIVKLAKFNTLLLFSPSKCSHFIRGLSRKNASLMICWIVSERLGTGCTKFVCQHHQCFGPIR